MNIFKALSWSGAEWFSAGLASSFPDLGSDEDNLLQPRMCNADLKPGCKVFQVPGADVSKASEVPISTDSLESSEIVGDLQTQVLVFQHNGKFYAIDHVSQVYSSQKLDKAEPNVLSNAPIPHTLFRMERLLISRTLVLSSALV